MKLLKKNLLRYRFRLLGILLTGMLIFSWGTWLLWQPNLPVPLQLSPTSVHDLPTFVAPMSQVRNATEMKKGAITWTAIYAPVMAVKQQEYGQYEVKILFDAPEAVVEKSLRVFVAGVPQEVRWVLQEKSKTAIFTTQLSQDGEEIEIELTGTATTAPPAFPSVVLMTKLSSATYVETEVLRISRFQAQLILRNSTALTRELILGNIDQRWTKRGVGNPNQQNEQQTYQLTYWPANILFIFSLLLSTLVIGIIITVFFKSKLGIQVKRFGMRLLLRSIKSRLMETLFWAAAIAVLFLLVFQFPRIFDFVATYPLLQVLVIALVLILIQAGWDLLVLFVCAMLLNLAYSFSSKSVPITDPEHISIIFFLWTLILTIKLPDLLAGFSLRGKSLIVQLLLSGFNHFKWLFSLLAYFVKKISYRFVQLSRDRNLRMFAPFFSLVFLLSGLINATFDDSQKSFSEMKRSIIFDNRQKKSIPMTAIYFIFSVIDFLSMPVFIPFFVVSIVSSFLYQLHFVYAFTDNKPNLFFFNIILSWQLFFLFFASVIVVIVYRKRHWLRKLSLFFLGIIIIQTLVFHSQQIFLRSHPIITQVKPDTASFWREITVQGHNFGNSPFNNAQILVNNKPHRVLLWEENRIVFVTDPKLSSSGDIVIINPDGKRSNAERFTYLKNP